MQTSSHLAEFVRASAVLLGIPMDAERVLRVADHLSRSAAMAQALDDAHLDVEDEPAQVYCPAPFPETLGAR